MSAPRFDVYTLVHKGQRRRLFELTAVAGQIGPDDHAKRQELAADVTAMLNSLVDHADAEDQYFGPLLAEADSKAAAEIHAGHKDLDAHMATLRGTLAKAVAEPSHPMNLATYRTLARFTSAYLAHIDLEEATQPALWARFDDARLMRTQSELVASHPPASSAFNLRNMIPACSSFERVKFLRGLKGGMPRPPSQTSAPPQLQW